MIKNSFMLLGIFSKIGEWISNAIGTVINAIFSVSSSIIETIIGYALNAIFPILTSLLVKSASLVAGLAYAFFDSLIDFFFHNYPSRPKNSLAEMITLSIVENVNTAFESIKCEEAIKKLNLRPDEYFKIPDKIPKVVHVGTGETETITLNIDTPFTIVQDIITNVIAPSAMVIFSLIIMVELFQITTRTEGMRNSGFESPFKLMIKVAICKIFLDHTKDVLNAIINFSHEMFVELYNLMMSRTYNFELLSREDALYLAGMHYISLVAWWLSIWILCGGIKLIINFVLPFVVLARMLELYIMIALAPLPFATFANQEFSQVGKNFVKQFVGIALKSFIIYLIIIIYSATFSCLIVQDDGFLTMINRFCKTGGGVLFSVAGFWGPFFLFIGAACIRPLIFCIMLLGTLLGADKYSKLITGAFY